MRNLITDPSTGFIGINSTTSPNYWLDVNGSIQTSSQLRVIDSNETLRARVGQGSVETFDSSGTRRAMIGPGDVNVYDSSGSRRALIGTPASGPGIVQTWGPNGLSNARLTSLGGFPNNGFVAVQDSAGTTRAGIHVDSSGNGIVWGDTKNFRMPNPNDAETEIWYASLEGPEAAAYVRGTAQLVDGQATITFPDHFLAVASEAGMTIQLTPLSADSLGLAVVQKSLAGIVVQELHGGAGT